MPTVKTAVSIDKNLFDAAKQLARELRLPRSRVFAIALDDYIQRRRNKTLLAHINEAYADGSDRIETAVRRRMRRHHRRAAEGQW